MTSSNAQSGNLPPGPILLLSKFLDIITLNKWRAYVPFGLTTPPDGYLSTQVPDLSSYYGTESSLLSYDQVPGGIWDFITADSTVLGDVTSPLSLFMVLILVLALRKVKHAVVPIFRGVGRKYGRATHGVEWEKANEERIVKFGEYVFRLIYHSLVSIYGIWYFRDKEWWQFLYGDNGSAACDSSQSCDAGGTKSLWVGHPFHPIEAGMTWYYLIQCAYNVDAMLSLIELSVEIRDPRKVGLRKCFGWSKTCRGDFREMMIHHIVTNLLVFMSSSFRFTRAGSMMFLIHDISDVPVDLSKLANFMKWRTTTICCFVFLVIMWLVCRLGIFPFYIFYSMSYESQLLMTTNASVDPALFYAWYHIFVVLMGSLIALNLAWFLMLVRMGILLVCKGETHDLSEHKDGEKDSYVQQQHQNVSNGMANCSSSSNGTNGILNGKHPSNGNHENH